MSESELEDLEALVASPGWQRFHAIADQEWGAVAYRQKAQRILSSLNLANTADAASLILQLECGAREVERLLTLPYERIKKLRARS